MTFFVAQQPASESGEVEQLRQQVAALEAQVTPLRAFRAEIQARYDEGGAITRREVKTALDRLAAADDHP